MCKISKAMQGELFLMIAILLVESLQIGVASEIFDDFLSPSQFPDTNASTLDALSPHARSASRRNIPETNLTTNTFYKLGLKHFPEGVLTWTFRSRQQYNYVQIATNPDQLPFYRPGQKWHLDSHWEFIPLISTTTRSESGWYGLRNRGRGLDAFLTWSPSDPTDTELGQSFHIILDTTLAGEHRPGDFALKPEMIKEVNEEGTEQTFYQIKLRNLPNGVVTWSPKTYLTRGSRLIEVDNSTDPDRMNKYQRGGDWFGNTLFTIEAA